MTRVFVVEDHVLMREMIQEVIELEADLSVSGSAGDAAAALVGIASAAPDVVLVDVSLPGTSGIGLVATIRVRHPAVKALMLSGHGERSYIEQALQAGASGYVVKTEAEHVPEIIRKIMAGERYVSPGVDASA